MSLGLGLGLTRGFIATASGSPTPPSIITAPVVSGTNSVGSTLSTTDGTWGGSTPQTLTRQFQRSTDSGSTWFNIGSYVTQALNTWTPFNASVGAGTTNPTFFSSNSKLTEDNTNNAHYIALPNGYMPSNGTYTFSIVAKASERDWIYLYIFDSPEGSGKGAWFNVSTGVIGTIESGITAQITNLGSGWFQCDITRTVNGDAADNGGVALASGDGVLTYTGTTGNGVFLTGAKVYTGNLSTYVATSSDVNALVRSFVYSTNSVGVASSASSNSLFINTQRTLAFLNATSISDATIRSALNTLDTSLVAGGLLPSGTGSGLLMAVYPIVGGTADTHKFNFANPANTNAAFRLQFFGSWTHSANGMISNGSNAYANTFLNPTTHLSNYNAHSSVYCRQAGSNAGFDLGATTSPGFAQEFLLAGRRGGNATSGLYDFFNSLGQIVVTTSSAVGFTLNSILSDTNHRLFKNGSQIGVNTLTNNTVRANFPIYIGAVNQNSTSAVEYANNQYAFATIGDGLTDAQQLALYNAVQAFNTTLGRQI